MSEGISTEGLPFVTPLTAIISHQQIWWLCRWVQTKEFLKNVWFSITLKKKVPDKEEHELDVQLDYWNILLMCVGVLSFSFYQEMPVVVNDFGYMIFFPLFLSGVMSYITSMCYAELISMNANAGGSYRYVYYTMGEFVGFLAGWFVIFICTMRFVFCMEYLIRVLDTLLFNSAITESCRKTFYLGGFDNYFVRIFKEAHVETLISSVIMTVLGVLKLRDKKYVALVFGFTNIAIVMICLTIFWFYMDLPKFNIVRGIIDFSFFTRGSIEGTIFYMDFEVAMYVGLETKNATRAAPKGLVGGCKWAFIIYFASTILYATREGNRQMDNFNKDTFNPMQTALSKMGLEPFHFIPSIGLFACLFMSASVGMYMFARVTYTMAKDGVMFPFLGIIHERLKTPYVSIILMGCITGILAVFVGLAPSTRLAMLAMASTIRILMLIVHLVTRYQWEPSQLHFKDHHVRWAIINHPKALLNPTKSTHTISIWLIFLTVLTTFSALFVLLNFILRIGQPSLASKLGFILSVIVGLAAVYLLSLQPQNDRRHLTYMVRGVPFTSHLAIGWYLLILILLPQAAWVKYFCWCLIGAIFYFSYVCMRSNEYKARKEEEENKEINVTPTHT